MAHSSRTRLLALLQQAGRGACQRDAGSLTLDSISLLRTAARALTSSIADTRHYSGAERCSNASTQQKHAGTCQSWDRPGSCQQDSSKAGDTASGQLGSLSAAAQCDRWTACTPPLRRHQLAWGHVAGGFAARPLLHQRRAASSDAAAPASATASPHASVPPGQQSDAGQRAAGSNWQTDDDASAAGPEAAAAPLAVDSIAATAAPPASWLDKRCPPWLLPYAQLMRLDKPIGEILARHQQYRAGDIVVIG